MTSAAPGATAPAERRWAGRVGHAEVAIENHDAMRWTTAVTLAGLAAAVVLALIGGMPFDVPMPTHVLGWVEPSCGLTRGSTAIARGDLARAWAYNPASFLVMAFGVFGVVRAGWGRLRGQWLTIRLGPSHLGWALLAIAGLALAAHQQSNADFVINARG